MSKPACRKKLPYLRGLHCHTKNTGNGDNPTGNQTQASKKYNDRVYERIKIRVKKGTRERYKIAAARRGLSLAMFLQIAAELYISQVPELDREI